MMKVGKMKTLTIIMVTMLALALMPYSAYSEDKSDRLNSQSSYTFSPGYVNAAKQQMESLKVNIPGEEKKSFLDKAVEYVQSKFGNKPEEGRIENKETAIALKGPKGGGGGGDTTQTQTMTTDNWRKYGDVTGDGKVDSNDLARVLASYNSKKGDSEYQSICDFNENGVVDYDDLMKIFNNYNQDLISYGIQHYTVTKVLVTVKDPYKDKDVRAGNDRSSSDYYKTSYQDNSATGKSKDAEKTKGGALSGPDTTALNQPPGDASEKYALSDQPIKTIYKGTELKDETDQSSSLSAAKEPTQDQQVVIDSITSLLSDMSDIEKPGDNPELEKASSELLAMVANVLLAQAIPDLLKEGDMSNIRNIFSQLDSGKSKILSDYVQSTKPYYDEVKKIIERNAGALDTQMDLKKLLQKEVPRSEIDKILEELKRKSKRSSEEEYILQQESKLKEKYIDPNKKKLEEDMKEMLSDVTKKLSATLEATKR
jgi:Ca2+-binding EF-hand superfamily protein